MQDPVTSAIRTLVQDRRSLSASEASALFQALLGRDVPPERIAGVLVALQMKGMDVVELLAAIEAVRARQVCVDGWSDTSIDVGGTGGDDGKTFNISTVAAIIAASAGARVLKHGSGSVSGKCGSIDLIRALNLAVAATPSAASESLSRWGIAFLDSRDFLSYPDSLWETRRQLGIPTVFNLAGPWCNPGRVKRQFIGVAHKSDVPQFIHAAESLGHDFALIVHGLDGEIDEFSISGASIVAEVRRGKTKVFEIQPADVGLPQSPLSAINGGHADECAQIARDIIRGADRGPRRNAVAFTAGAALYVAGRASTIRCGVQDALEAINSGRAARLLGALESPARSQNS